MRSAGEGAGADAAPPRLPPESLEDLPADLVDLPAQEGARWLALLRLREMVAARERLAGGNDTEALHDLRVALRRLRSTLRAYRALVDDSVSRTTRRRLARLATATGASRDVEVHLEWLAGECTELALSQPAGVRWVERALRRDSHTTGRELQRALDRDFARTTERLERRLLRYRVTLALGKGRELPPLREPMSRVLHELAEALEGTLAGARSFDDARRLHRARIAAKRLRYALEPLTGAIGAPAAVGRTARAAVSRLQQLQDDLGLVRDAHVLGAWLADRAAESAARTTRAATLGERDESADAPLTDEEALRIVTEMQRRLRERAESRWTAVDARASRRDLARMIRSVHTAARRLAPR